MNHMYDPRDKLPGEDHEAETDWSGWFATPGDMDDFIYYGEAQSHESER